ncbi:type VII secretion target [Amycolatopsis anabasis]|uniref:type VII secretion target n=1 Tax=Amycolatopsis anabasis TaxID=1840409 RepID=UPI00131D1837|nr:type VII secretion target [Amycolatopsis anabasis]
MSADAYEVTPEELRAHGSHLDGLVDRLHTAASAAKTVSMADDAYGLLCAFLPPIINPMEQKAREALDAAAEGVSTNADAIRSAATSYDNEENTNKAPFAAAEGRV